MSYRREGDYIVVRRSRKQKNFLSCLDFPISPEKQRVIDAVRREAIRCGNERLARYGRGRTAS